MQEHLTVPAEYADDFRAAIVIEIGLQAKYIEEHRREGEVEDMRNDMRLLAEDTAMLELVGHNGNGGLKAPVTGQRDAETVAHVLESMARRIVGPRLAGQLGYSPIDVRAAPEMREVIDRLGWTIDNAAKFHDLAAEQREGRAA